MKIVVYHGYYGCDTGCCGHYVEMFDGDDLIKREFDFSHDYRDNKIEFAKKLIRDEFGEEHVKDLDWENCIIENGEKC